MCGAFCCALGLNIQGQQQQYANLGECRLESGAVIQNCVVGYRTFGKPNADHSNAILLPTWFLGRSSDLSSMIGPGKLLDSSKFFVIAVDALGDGVSSSPSNSKSQPRMKFPRFTIKDMVESQYRMLTETLGIKHLHAVIGQSMGGIQAFEWMIDHPDFMSRTVAVAGTPRVATSDILWISVEKQSILNDKDWDAGNYTAEPKLLAARYMHLFVMWSPSQLNTNIAAKDAQKLLEMGASFGGDFDAADWLYQLNAILSMNAYGNRTPKEVSSTVHSKVLIVNATQDMAVNPEEAIQFAHDLSVTPVVLTDACGHMAVSCDAARVTPVIQDFLKQ